MDDLSRIGTQVNRTSDTFDLQSHENSVNSGDQTLSVAQKSVKQPFVEGHKEMKDGGELELLKMTSRQDGVELEKKNSESIKLPSFAETWKRSPISHTLPDVPHLYKDETDMDGIRRIDEQLNSNREDTFDLESSEEYDDSDEELKDDTFDLESSEEYDDSDEEPKDVTYEDQSVVQKSVSAPFVERHEELTDIRELEYLKKTFREDTVELERKNSESIQLPAFSEIWKRSPMSNVSSDVQHQYHDQAEVDCNRRVDPHVPSTSHDTFGLLSYEDILDMEQERNLDNVQENLICEEYRNSTLLPVEPLICLPEDFLPSPGCTNHIAPSAVVQQQLQQIVELQSYNQQLRIQEVPTLTSSQLSNSMPMQTPPPFSKTESQKQLQQIGFVPQLMPASAKRLPKEMSDEEEIIQFVEKFKQKRFELGLTPKQVSSSIKKLLGETITYHDINLFEYLNLQRKNMRSLKSVLQRWLQCIDTSNSLRNLKTPLAISCNTSKVSDISRKFGNSAYSMVKEPQEKTVLQNPRPAESSIDCFPRLEEQLSKTRESRVTFDWKSFVDHSAQDHNLGHVNQISGPPKQQKDLTQFVQKFKDWKKEFAISSEKVAKGISKMAGEQISQKWIIRFESYNLTTKLMRSFKSVILQWLQDNDPSNNISGTSRPTKSYPCITPEVTDLLLKLRDPFNQLTKDILENSFLENPRPSVQEIATLAESLNVDKHHVQSWFTNRRKREKRK